MKPFMERVFRVTLLVAEGPVDSLETTEGLISLTTTAVIVIVTVTAAASRALWPGP